MDFLRYKTLGTDLTTYDLLKSLAVVLMMIDHIGGYILTDELAWRWFSSSAPIWFFLVGYANSRYTGALLWAGAGLLLVANVISGTSLLPLNILAVILVVRAVLDPLMAMAGRDAYRLGAVALLLTLLMPPAMMILEYGTLGFLLAMLGYMLKNRADPFHARVTVGFTAYTMVVFMAFHMATYAFTQAGLLWFFFSSLAIFLLVFRFRPRPLPGLTRALPRPLVVILQSMGRNSLIFYVLHVILFMAIGMALGAARYYPFHLEIFPF